MRTRADSPERIQRDFPGWHIWRSQRDGVPKSWVASLLDPTVGVDLTVIRDTPAELRKELKGQRRRVSRGVLPNVVVGL